MQFSDTTLKQGIVQMIDELCSTNANTFPIADKVRSINNYYDRLFTIQALQAGTRQPHDSNLTIIAQYTTPFIAGDRQFTMPENTLFIDHVEITDKSGTPIVIKRRDKAELQDAWNNQGEGTPTSYDEQGDFYVFDKTFDYSGTIYLWATVLPSLFDASDTTKTPGVLRVLHQYIAYGVAVDYCARNLQERVPLYEKRLSEYETMSKRLVGKDKKRIKPYTATRNSSK